MREKYKSEQQSKAKIQAEVEEMKRQYEEKLKDLNERAKTATEKSPRTSVTLNNGEVVVTPETETDKDNADNEEQKAAMEKLRKLQASLLDGGKRADDKDLKEKRLRKKKAAEKRLKVLGEALGHVDDEDGVLVKVYDDIQTELAEKTQ